MGMKMQRAKANVFQDLGFDPEESENLRVRADLMIELSKLIEMKGWTQEEAAKIMGVSQPRISDLVRGKFDRFSIDSLISMLGSAGIRVRITTTLKGVAYPPARYLRT